MENFTKYYSYNQLVEEHDILVMTEQEYLNNKDNLDNPQRIVLVKREGGPKEPKIPKWFQSYKEETDSKFKQIDTKFKQANEQMPEWFKHWYENEYQKTQPAWFKHWCEQEFKPLAKRIDNIVLKNNLKE